MEFRPTTASSMAVTKTTPSRVTLRQLCRLGLPAPLLLPSLLPVLRELVPATHAGFFFCDAKGSITNMYAERMLAPGMMAAYHDRHSESNFRAQYLQRVAAAKPTSRRSVSAQEKAGAYYKEVLTALGVEHFLYGIVRHGGKVLGQLSLYRDVQALPFSDADEETLADVLHYLGEALSVPTPVPLRDLQAHTVEEGLALLDAQGTELFADGNWQRLIRLAQGGTISPANALAEVEAVPRFVLAVLSAVVSAPHAIHQVESTWGNFAFRQHNMASREGGEALALIVSRLAAEPVRLTAGAAALSLSPQQREVAVLVAQGHSNQNIADSMGITLNTASYHVKQVFTRLNVHERSAVAQALVKAAEAAGI
jgi:DNA-binding CsgD family transcriptional regulator